MERVRYRDCLRMGGSQRNYSVERLPTLNHSPSVGLQGRSFYCTVGHGETSGDTVSLPYLPLILRANVLCFRKKENFGDEGL